jgi:hypothetical protein
VFGFGTDPEGSIVVVPEPSAYALASLGAVAIACRCAWRHKRHARHRQVT